MHHRALVVLCCAALLAACGSDRPKTEPAAPPAPAKTATSKTVPLGPLPAYQRELSGTLLEIPAGATVELALLVIDERGRPQQLLASSTLTGTGQALPYQLRFNPEAFPAGARVELRGRASQSGQLIMHLPPQPIAQAQTQATGPLRFEQAP
ncbi:YbaY family lipoprotein [Pseudomonas sp. SWRI107]|uniref:YbaY family lipoprotein n=1 Tax=Pseudomonas TaxID=286 RepID=UPI001648E87E|nr:MULTISPECIES: YbaY family lipoprotein [Pseudomonas]MBC3411757.1 YbaY family lipoprotein [Pseudomonas sp. SWRI51]MBV4532700.1 YbaY family lipoprotein [Pseudomonas farsensis]